MQGFSGWLKLSLYVCLDKAPDELLACIYLYNVTTDIGSLVKIASWDSAHSDTLSKLLQSILVKTRYQGHLLLTWINFNPSMNK